MIKIQELSFSYNTTGSKILDHITCDLEQGHCVAILGNNGAGKSTLLKCLNRIHKIKEGAVLVDGKNAFSMPRRDLAKKLAYVPQRNEISHTMVFDAVLLGRKPYIQWDATEQDKKIVAEILEKFELTPYATRYINELSGGEIQRVILARAMAQQPQYLLLDEPTSNLDPRNQHEMMRIVQEISQQQNIGVVIVIHDLNLAARYCDRFLFIHDAKIYSYGDLTTLTPGAIHDVYGMDVDIIEYRGNKLIISL